MHPQHFVVVSITGILKSPSGYYKVPQKSNEFNKNQDGKKGEADFIAKANAQIEDEENRERPEKPLSLPPVALNANLEFIAFGLTNMIGSFFHSQVVSASFSRSALNFEMNGHSQITSVIQAVIGLLSLLYLMPFLSPLPKCVLAAVVTASVNRLIKNGVNEFKFLMRVSRMELMEFMVAVIAPLIIGLEIGIFIAIGTSILVNLLRHSFASIIYLGRLHSDIFDEAEYVDCEVFKEAEYIPNITIIEMKAELSFSNNKFSGWMP